MTRLSGSSVLSVSDTSRRPKFSNELRIPTVSPFLFMKMRKLFILPDVLSLYLYGQALCILGYDKLHFRRGIFSPNSPNKTDHICSADWKIS